MNTQITQELLDSLRSKEEKMFVFWLREAVEMKLIDGFEYEKYSFMLCAECKITTKVELKTKEVMKDVHIHRSESYTPDFAIRLTEIGYKVLGEIFRKSLLVRDEDLVKHELIFIDVKGGFNPYQTDERYFSLVRKILREKQGIWVEKVVPAERKKGEMHGFFTKTWCPEPYRWMKNRKVPTLTSLGSACITAAEFLQNQGAVIDEQGKPHITEQKELF